MTDPVVHGRGFRNIALIFSLEKPCYLGNRVVREPCKRRTACTNFNIERYLMLLFESMSNFFFKTHQKFKGGNWKHFNVNSKSIYILNQSHILHAS